MHRTAALRELPPAIRRAPFVQKPPLETVEAEGELTRNELEQLCGRRLWIMKRLWQITHQTEEQLLAAPAWETGWAIQIEDELRSIERQLRRRMAPGAEPITASTILTVTDPRPQEPIDGRKPRGIRIHRRT